MIDPVSVAEHLAGIRDRIHRAGGSPDVVVVAVTKGFGPDAIDAAVAAGLADVGENYAQELLAKLGGISVPAPRIHFIGRLQSNKVRLLAPHVDVWQSVDRLSLVRELARRAPGAAVLVQVNTSGEPQKGGCEEADVHELVTAADAAGLMVRGLMTVGPLAEPEAARPGFRRLRRLCDDLGLPVCSMGMTDDLEVAVSEGATMVRIGTALFGTRPPAHPGGAVA